MRLTLSVLALGAMVMQAAPVFAQTTLPATGGTGQAGSLPVAPAPTGPVSSPNALPSKPPGAATTASPGAPTATHRARQSLDARFAAANTTHDGHLTLEQAQAANWSYVAKNFAAMDKGSKGYVTTADVRGYTHARRAARKHTPSATAPAGATSPQPMSPQ